MTVLNTTVGSHQALPITLKLAIAFLIVQDSLASVFHIQSYVTILIFGLLLFTWLTLFSASPRTSVSFRGTPWPTTFFLLWAAFVTVFVGWYGEASIQHLAVWTIFALSFAITYAKWSPGLLDRTSRLWRIAGVAASLIYIAQCVVQGRFGAEGFPYSDRGAGWTLLVALIVILPRVVVLGESWWPPLVIFLAIVLSESRTPIAIACVMLVISAALRPHRRFRPTLARVLVRAVGLSFIVGTLAVVGLLSIPAIRDRFLIGDGYAIDGVTINSSGRFVLWDLTFADASNSWLIGHGAGRAQSFITSYFHGWIAHPHNEYLRLLDDTGAVGLVLWNLGLVIVVARAVIGIRRARSDRSILALHISVILGVLVMALGSITDNTTVTIGHMIALGALFGCGSAAVEDLRIRRLLSPQAISAPRSAPDTVFSP